MRRAYRALLLVSLLTPAHVLAESNPNISQSTNTYQASFLAAVDALNRGDYSSSIALFEALLAETHSLRVKLELARARFMARDYEKSRILLNEVLVTPELPWRVEETIRLFLAEIDEETGFIKFSIGMTSDTNPRNFTSSREVILGRQSLTVVPPADNRKVHGIRFAARGYQSLNKQRKASGFLTASYSDFSGSTFDRLNADIGLSHEIPDSPWLKAKIGVEGAILDGNVLYRLPYLGFGAILSHGIRHLHAELKLGELSIPQMPFMHAHSLALDTKLAHPPSKALAISNGLSLERSIAEEAAYSYLAGHIGATGVWQTPWLDLRLTLSGSVGKRIYDAPDPFFGARRYDSMSRFSLDVLRPSWRVFGYRPQFGIMYEQTTSNLDYYSFKKTGLNILLEG
jgi:hypothetical protein